MCCKKYCGKSSQSRGFTLCLWWVLLSCCLTLYPLPFQLNRSWPKPLRTSQQTLVQLPDFPVQWMEFQNQRCFFHLEIISVFFFISYLISVQHPSSLPSLPGGLGKGREQTQPWQNRSRGRSSFEDPRSNIERCWGISVCCGEYCWGH